MFVSNGGIEKDQLLGTEESLDNARGFFTMQHGENDTFEFFAVPEHREFFVPVVVQWHAGTRPACG